MNSEREPQRAGGGGVVLKHCIAAPRRNAPRNGTNHVFLKINTNPNFRLKTEGAKKTYFSAFRCLFAISLHFSASGLFASILAKFRSNAFKK
jgi:hypothetical protein